MFINVPSIDVIKKFIFVSPIDSIRILLRGLRHENICSLYIFIIVDAFDSEMVNLKMSQNNVMGISIGNFQCKPLTRQFHEHGHILSAGMTES